MSIYKTNKVLEFNKNGFHASHVVNCELSIVEIFPEPNRKDGDKPKEKNGDAIHLHVKTENREYPEQGGSAYITLDKKQIKELIGVLNKFI